MKVLYFLLFGLLCWGCGPISQDIAKPPVVKGSTQPSLITTEKGLLLSWMEPSEGDILLRMSLYNGIAWNAPKTIAKGENWFVNWADFPSITANGDKLFSYFLQKSANSTYAYDIMFSVSEDMGEHWSTPSKLHDDTVAAEHGFVSAVPYKDGFYAVWLDGRNTVAAGGMMTLRGAAISSTEFPLETLEIDSSTCDCCQTSIALVNSTPVVFYRNRTEDEIRDIYYAKFDGQWSKPALLNEDNWYIKGCPVNGPNLASFGGNLAVAWFTGADDNYQVKLKISHNEAESFGKEIIVEENYAMGRVNVQMDSSRIFVTFMSKQDNKAIIKLNIYNHQGGLLSREIIAHVNGDRGTGFPRTALWEDKLIFTWTDIDEMKVKVLSYPINRKVGLKAQAF